MQPSDLTPGKTYLYTQGDKEPIQLKYWYEQLNYWSFTAVVGPYKLFLLHSQQILKDLNEITV